MIEPRKPVTCEYCGKELRFLGQDGMPQLMFGLPVYSTCGCTPVPLEGSVGDKSSFVEAGR